MSENVLSPLRKIKLFFPPIDSPLLTPYGKAVMPKVTPLKERFSVFSQRRQSKISQNPQTVYMSSSDIDIVNNSYRKIKRSRCESIPLKQSEFAKDPLYKSIYDLKHQSIMQVRAKSRKNMLKLDLS